MQQGKSQQQLKSMKIFDQLIESFLMDFFFLMELFWYSESMSTKTFSELFTFWLGYIFIQRVPVNNEHERMVPNKG